MNIVGLLLFAAWPFVILPVGCSISLARRAPDVEPAAERRYVVGGRAVQGFLDGLILAAITTVGWCVAWVIGLGAVAAALGALTSWVGLGTEVGVAVAVGIGVVVFVGLNVRILFTADGRGIFQSIR